MPGDKTQENLFLSPFEWKARHSSIPVPKCHNTLNRLFIRGLKATNTQKEAENDVLKRHILKFDRVYKVDFEFDVLFASILRLRQSDFIYTYSIYGLPLFIFVIRIRYQGRTIRKGMGGGGFLACQNFFGPISCAIIVFLVTALCMIFFFEKIFSLCTICY